MKRICLPIVLALLGVLPMVLSMYVIDKLQTEAKEAQPCECADKLAPDIPLTETEFKLLQSVLRLEMEVKELRTWQHAADQRLKEMGEEPIVAGEGR